MHFFPCIVLLLLFLCSLCMLSRNHGKKLVPHSEQSKTMKPKERSAGIMAKNIRGEGSDRSSETSSTHGMFGQCPATPKCCGFHQFQLVPTGQSREISRLCLQHSLQCCFLESGSILVCRKWALPWGIQVFLPSTVPASQELGEGSGGKYERYPQGVMRPQRTMLLKSL